MRVHGSRSITPLLRVMCVASSIGTTRSFKVAVFTSEAGGSWRSLAPSCRPRQLIKDTKWWRTDNTDNGIECKILSAKTLLRDRTTMVTVRQGLAALGIIEVTATTSIELPYVSKQWFVGFVKDISSHKNELYALRDFLCTTRQ